MPSTPTRNSRPFTECYYLENCVLGRGSFSTVYECTRVKNQTKCAVKCMDKKGLNQDEILGIMDEVSILQSLKPQHPNIVRLYDFFEDSSTFYLVMESMNGGELFDKIVAKQFYSEREARDVCKIILNAVEFLHSKGVVHRDLKPDNLLLVSSDNDALVKIADFGFATRCDDHGNGGLGTLLTQCGTPAYVAPEIIQRNPYGSKCDMWSIGVILYVLLGGYEPFCENDKMEMYRKIVNGDFEFHADCWGHVSEEAKNLISSLLEVDPTKRLSANDALCSNWIRSDDGFLAEKDLTSPNFGNLKRYNAKRKVRAAVHALIAVNKLNILRNSVDEDVRTLKL